MSVVDLVIVFDATSVTKEGAERVGKEYSKLLSTLRSGGIKAVGKKGATHGQVLVLLQCQESKLLDIARREA